MPINNIKTNVELLNDTVVNPSDSEIYIRVVEASPVTNQVTDKQTIAELLNNINDIDKLRIIII